MKYLVVLVPQFVESSVKTIIFIIKEDNPLMEEIEGQSGALSEFFEVILVENMGEV